MFLRRDSSTGIGEGSVVEGRFNNVVDDDGKRCYDQALFGRCDDAIV